MSPQEMKQQKLRQTYQALLKLMARKPLIDITVAELCRAARVSRTYYYRAFAGMPDIVKQYQITMTVDYMRHIHSTGPQTFAALMSNYFRLAQKNAEEELMLVNAGLMETMVQTFRDTFHTLVDNGVVDRNRSRRMNLPYYEQLISGGIVMVKVQWLRDGMPNSPEQLGSVVAGMFGA